MHCKYVNEKDEMDGVYNSQDKENGRKCGKRQKAKKEAPHSSCRVMKTIVIDRIIYSSHGKSSSSTRVHVK